MSSYFVRKFSECKRVTLDNAVGFRAMMENGTPQQVEIARRMLQNPDIEFYRLVSPDMTDGRYAVSYVRLTGGEDFPEHCHDDVFATVYILEGRGYAVIDGTRHSLAAGDVVYLPPGTMHVVGAENGPLAYLACASPDIGQDGKPHITFK